MTSEQLTLEDAPVGLLKTVDGVIILKTEYRSESGAIDAYLVESGEYFWGGQPQTAEKQKKELVVRWPPQRFVVSRAYDGVKPFLRAVMSEKSLVGVLEPESRREISEVFEDVRLVCQCDHLVALAELREAELHARADAEAAQARVALLQKDKARWEWVKRKMAFAIMDAIMEHVEEKGGCVPGGITSTSIDTYIDSFIASEVAS
ncbi:hypothetical protein [Acetobacter sp.]|uniref:hypothetical protein n=1 Tax=Acetobacter sp. TaxID=440 RepID=UPI0039EC4156